MQTDSILISSDLSGRTEALREAERFCVYYGLTGKDAMHIRLLTEEAISLVADIVRGFEGSFRIKSEKTAEGLLCRLCIEANVSVSEMQETRLLSAATSGKNEAAAGILGKIRQLFRWSIQQTDAEAFAQSGVIGSWYTMGVNDEAYWSLQKYTRRIRQETPDSEACDELEKSIIAQVADEVRVGIQCERAEVIIEKRIAGC